MEEDVALTGKSGKKSQNIKNTEMGLTDSTPHHMVDSFELGKEENSEHKKNKKMKYGRVCVESDETYQEAKGERIKRKKLKLQAAEERVASEDETHMEGEDKRNSQTNGDEDAGYSDGLKANKDKNRRTKSRNEDTSAVLLCSRIVHLDNSKKDSAVVERQKSFEETEDVAEAENGEGGSKKKNKRKRLKEEDDDKRPKEIRVGGGAGKWKVGHDGNNTEKVEKKKKQKKKTNVDDLENHEGNNTKTVEKKKKKINIDDLENLEGNKKTKTNVDDLENLDGNSTEKVEKKKKNKTNLYDQDNQDGNDMEEGEKKKKKKKKTNVHDLDNRDGNNIDKVEKKKKKKNKTNVDDLDIRVAEIMVDGKGNKSTMNGDNDFTNRSEENAKKAKKKKLQSVGNGSERPKCEGKSMKVRFSDHAEIFPLSEEPSSGKEGDRDKGLVRGKRFSLEEDEIVRESVLTYIEEHQLGEEGIDMVMNCRSYPEMKNCWKEIGAVMPYRPILSINHRAHILFERAEKRGWTSEEIELVRKLHKEHGPNWKKIGSILGKRRHHVSDTWRRIKLPNLKKGRLSQDEYQNLFNLVNLDLRMKVFEEKKSQHGMLRDNICWNAISDKLSTRTSPFCCKKWYTQLSSPTVVEGEWADSDDYRLVIALFDLDACCIEDVDWDTLLEHRSGYVCRKRWFQMVRHLGQHRNTSFAEQVDILSKRYCRDTLEAREVWEKKPVVP